MDFVIKDILKKRGLSTKAFAAQLGKAPQYVSNIINGGKGASLSTLNDIAAALGVPLWQLFISPDDLQSEKEKRAKGFQAIIKDGARCYTADNWEEVCDLYVKHKNGDLV